MTRVRGDWVSQLADHVAPNGSLLPPDQTMISGMQAPELDRKPPVRFEERAPEKRTGPYRPIPAAQAATGAPQKQSRHPLSVYM